MINSRVITDKLRVRVFMYVFYVFMCVRACKSFYLYLKLKSTNSIKMTSKNKTIAIIGAGPVRIDLILLIILLVF